MELLMISLILYYLLSLGLGIYGHSRFHDFTLDDLILFTILFWIIGPLIFYCYLDPYSSKEYVLFKAREKDLK